MCAYRNDVSRENWIYQKVQFLFADACSKYNSKFNMGINPHNNIGRIFNLFSPNDRRELRELIRSGVYLNNMKIIVGIIIDGKYEERIFYLHNFKGYNTKYIFYCIFNGGASKICKHYRSESSCNNNPVYNYDDTILDKFLDPNSPFSECIPHLARLVIRLLKFSEKGLFKYYRNEQNPGLEKYVNNELIWAAIEIYLMIITTERFRSELSILQTYIELYKLKHATSNAMARDMLDALFDKYDSILKFACTGGCDNIYSTNSTFFFKSFLSMLDYAPIPSYFKNSSEIRYKFYRRKYEKLIAINEDNLSIQYSHLKDNYNRNKYSFIGDNYNNSVKLVNMNLTVLEYPLF